MPLDFDTIEPRDGTGIVRSRGPRATGPNPFLDKGWLWESYETSKDKEVGPIAGILTDTVVSRGATAGQPTQKWTGDVATVISMLRTAAEKQGIGVSIEIIPATTARGREITGQYTVKYLGKERRQRRTADDNGTVDDE
jgi:hypothetical protein